MTGIPNPPNINDKNRTLNPVTEERQIDLFNKLPITAFGDLRIAELSPIFQGSFEYTVSNTEITESIAVAPASVTQSNGMAVISTSTTTGRRATLQSHIHAKYKAGLGGLGRFTGLLTTGVPNTSQWIGLFDEIGSTADFKNGYGIGFDGDILSVVRFQNDVKFAVPRTSWDDKLDGTGTSGMIIDPTKLK